MKIVIKTVVVLFVLLAIALVGSWFYLDRILYQAIVRIGPQVTGTSVELAEVSLKPLSGELALSGLNIGNPEGFVAPYVFSLGGVDLAVDMESVNQPVLVIDRLIIDAPRITYEATPQGDNLRTLQANIARNTGADEADEVDEADTGEGRKVIIEQLLIRSGQISVSHYLMADQVTNVNLPELEMTGIGSRSGGATVAEVASQILEFLSQQAYQAAMNSDQLESVLQDVQGQMQERLQELEEESGVGDQIRGLLNSLGR